MNKERLITLSLFVLAAAASRLLPHAPNFTPVAAIALFSGATFERKWMAFVVPFLALLASDAILGFYGLSEMIATYAGFAAVVALGFLVRGRQQFLPIASATLGGAIVFFLITNCNLLVNPSLYPQTPAGMMESYIAGIPFFRNTLMSDILYSAILFGAFAMAEFRFARLRVQSLARA